MNALPNLSLSPKHQAMLDASAISPDVAEQRGYRTITSKAEIVQLGFADFQARTPALLIPIHGLGCVAGAVRYQLRPDDPRLNERGKAIKYETPAGARMTLDVPPATRAVLDDPSVPLIFTEGIKKVDAIESAGGYAAGLLGVFNYRGKGEDGETADLRDFEHINLARRVTYVGYDSDVMTNPKVKAALDGLTALLQKHGALVRHIFLPDAADGGKQGIDDFLAAGHTMDDVYALARDAPDDGSDDVPKEDTHPATADTFVVERQLNESANALRLRGRHGENLRYCAVLGQWLLWDETRWEPDDTGAIIERVKDVSASIYVEAANAPEAYREDYAKWARRSHSLSVIKATATLAQSIPTLAVRPDDLDADPWLFNILNGTINLRTGDHRPHDRADLITKVAPVRYDASATCPTFLRFLERVIPNADTRGFLQRFAGYSLTGNTREDAMAILYGSGRNGKTTFVELLRDLLGDYGVQTPTETLMVKRDGAIPNDLARLKGARFVAAAEGNDGQRLAEGTIKALTGRDRIPARFLNHEWFTFPPTFKVWFSTNHRPIVRGTDIAIWERLRLIPFTVRFYRADELTDEYRQRNAEALAAGELEPYPPMDVELPDKLRAEMPGVLNWMLEGCRDWRANGLGTPEEVKTATANYRDEMDTLGNWIADCCIEGPKMTASAKQLYASYVAWCEGNGERTGSQNALGKSLGERGYTSERTRDGVHWFGIGIIDAPHQGNFNTEERSVNLVNLCEPKNGVVSRDHAKFNLPLNKVHKGSQGSHDTETPLAAEDLPDRVALRKWADDEALGWENPTFPEAAIREATRRYYALTIPEGSPRKEMADLILAAMKGLPQTKGGAQ